jgi:exonuclease III
VAQFRLVSWCIGEDERRRQTAWVEAQAPDLVALQDVPDDDYAAWRDDLASIGLVHTLAAAGQTGRRRVMVASRWRMQPGTRLEGAHPERFLEAHVGGPRAFGLITARVPYKPGAGPADPDFLDAVTRRRMHMDTPALFCGVLGTPALEFDTGQSTIPVPFHPKREESEARRELSALMVQGWSDLYRAANPRVQRHDQSTAIRGRFPRRIDHVLGAGKWSCTSARYDLAVMHDGLGTHAPLVADLALR